MIGMVEVDNMDTKSSDIGEKNVKENMNGKEHCESWKTVGKKNVQRAGRGGDDWRHRPRAEAMDEG